MATGVVKWYLDYKGCGFITSDNDRKDIYVQHTALQISGLRTLNEGERVEFEITKGPKGLEAQNVRLL